MQGNGLGLRPPHFREIIEIKPSVGWFEIITENFLFSHGNARDVLAQVRQNYPIVAHGVSLNIGSTDPIDNDFLQQLKSFNDQYEFEWISDHLCWTGVNNINSHDLLPVPYTEESLKHCANRIETIQNFLAQEIVLENPSSYLEFSSNEYSEKDFLVELTKRSGCKVLLDVNNVYVSSFNHGYDAIEFISAIPTDRIAQIHLAGHENNGDIIIDTHDSFVIDNVWQLYREALRVHGPKPTMIEWDANIPEFSVLMSEFEKLESISKEFL